MSQKVKLQLLLKVLRYAISHFPFRTKRLLSMAFPMAMIAYLVHYRKVLHFKVLYKGALSTSIAMRMPVLNTKKFYASPYFLHKYSQSYLCTKRMVNNRDLVHESEVFDFSSGGKCILEWLSFKSRTIEYNPELIVLIVPGTNTAANAPYVEDLAIDLMKLNYKTLIYMPRVNQKNFIAPTEGFLNFETDLHDAVVHVREKCPNTRLVLIGYSMGANTVVNYLAKYPNDTSIAAGISISNPFDLGKTSKKLYGTVADSFLLKGILEKARVHREYFDSIKEKFLFDIEEILSAKTSLEFERAFNVKIMGYRDANAYYEGISSLKNLSKVNHPLLILNAIDDPFIDQSSLPINITNEKPNILLLLTQKGGHLGWVSGFFRLKRWSSRVVIEFLSAINTPLDM